MESRGFTYIGLLGIVSDSGTQFRALAFANCKLAVYLKEEHANPKDNEHYWIEEVRNGKAVKRIHLVGNQIMNRIKDHAKHHNIPFDVFSKTFTELLLESMIQRSLIIVYEAISNYKRVNDKKELIKELSKNDWFRMIRILRDHFSHFYNMGLKVKFPDSLPYKHLNEVSWNGLTIRNGQPADRIHASIGYIIELLDHCYNYLRDNESTLK